MTIVESMTALESFGRLSFHIWKKFAIEALNDGINGG
jgi:hypothetical protein